MESPFKSNQTSISISQERPQAKEYGNHSAYLFLQQWYSLPDSAAEESLYDSELIRRFTDLELDDDEIPDKTTTINFRNLLDKHQFTGSIFDSV